jgi:hypothetical protein
VPYEMHCFHLLKMFLMIHDDNAIVNSILRTCPASQRGSRHSVLIPQRPRGPTAESGLLLVKHEKGSGTDGAAKAKRTVERVPSGQWKCRASRSGARDVAKTIALKPAKSDWSLRPPSYSKAWGACIRLHQS